MRVRKREHCRNFSPEDSLCDKYVCAPAFEAKPDCTQSRLYTQAIVFLLSEIIRPISVVRVPFFFTNQNFFCAMTTKLHTLPESEEAMMRVYRIALRELGVQERSGAGEHHPRIVAYHQTTNLPQTPTGALSDETPWCASFVNWCLREAGYAGTNSARARSFLSFGMPVAPDEIRRGDIVIFSRGVHPTAGHVGFFVDWSSASASVMTVLGGNQSNRVSFARYARKDLLGIRRVKAETR